MDTATVQRHGSAVHGHCVGSSEPPTPVHLPKKGLGGAETEDMGKLVDGGSDKIRSARRDIAPTGRGNRYIYFFFT